MIDLTKVQELIRISSMESANTLLRDGWTLLALEDGEYLLARIK